jgi:hypothetical protein
VNFQTDVNLLLAAYTPRVLFTAEILRLDTTLTNYYTKEETDSRIVSGSPTGYATTAQLNSQATTLNTAISDMGALLNTSINTLDTRLYGFDARRQLTILVGDIGTGVGLTTTPVNCTWWTQATNFITNITK